MGNIHWNDFEYGNCEAFEEVEYGNKPKNVKKQVKKRKWKEIENIKEKRKLKEALSTFEYYTELIN